jgi:CDP-glucose 4,6-dehydratase
LEGLVGADFWRGKRVFLTGHTGFKGSWLSLWLLSKGANLTGYSLPPPTNPSLFELGKVADDMQSVIGDIRDEHTLNSALLASNAEIVIHMAAQPLVRTSYSDPIATYATNVMGTANVLNAIRGAKTVRAVLVVTSDKCYENREWVWSYRESDPLGGYDPYSSSKGCAELVTAAFRSSFFPPEEHFRHGVLIASARAGNVISGGDWAEDRLVPDVMRAFLRGQMAVIRQPDAIRPWQSVLDPLRGYLLLAESLFGGRIECGSAFNFGPTENDVRPVRWIVERMATLWGRDACFQVARPEEEHHEALLLKLESSKARHILRWKPHSCLDQTMQSLVSWYQAYAANADMRAATLDQIKSYETALTSA